MSVRVEALKAKTGRTPILFWLGMTVHLQLMYVWKVMPRRYGFIKNRITTRNDNMLAEIEKLNANPDVHGILIQFLHKLMSVHVLMQSH